VLKYMEAGTSMFTIARCLTRPQPPVSIFPRSCELDHIVHSADWSSNRCEPLRDSALGALELCIHL
jgi:hypothetical protein